MQQRQLGPFSVSEISLGCMNLSHAYAKPPEQEYSIKLLNQSLDAGYNMLDTAALYGFGANESLLGKAVMHRRDEFVLASKCGMFKNAEGKREISNRPEVLRKHCEDSLQRLGAEVIDLYYLHRWDKQTPIEEPVGEMSRLVEEGKVRTLGLSEVSADTLRKAHREHPIAALQTEYSLWTRNPEIKVLETCQELGTAFVAFSPLARAFLTGTLTDIDSLESGDLRRNMPRFDAQTYAENLSLLDPLKALVEKHNCTMGQLSLAWLLAKAEHIIPIPGTTSIEHMLENAAASEVILDAESIQIMDDAINQTTVQGPRYNAATQLEIDTEEFNQN
jgi:aryl-alcohol dehydrogenase-like predicted oxidoreductase